MNKQADLDKALKDPALVYQRPVEVLNDTRLSDVERKEVLKRWEQDQRELDVAQEEGMTGGEASILDDILEALESLGVDIDSPEAPTKHGGPAD